MKYYLVETESFALPFLHCEAVCNPLADDEGRFGKDRRSLIVQPPSNTSTTSPSLTSSRPIAYCQDLPLPRGDGLHLDRLVLVASQHRAHSSTHGCQGGEVAQDGDVAQVEEDGGVDDLVLDTAVAVSQGLGKVIRC